MHSYSHDIALALAAHAGVKSAFDRRLGAARDALTYWRTSAVPDFLALRRSVEDGAEIEKARAVAAHLAKNTTDVLLFGIGGSSLGAQTLAQLAAWGTPAYAPVEGRPR